MNPIEQAYLLATNVYRIEHGLPPLSDESNAPVQRGSVLWNRLMVGGADDINRRLDALDWPAEGKDYGRDSIYRDREGVLRVRANELEP